MMIKVSNTSYLADWPQVLDLGKEGEAQKRLVRPAPAEPLAFFGGHEYGSKTYTNGADRDAIVAPKCALACFVYALPALCMPRVLRLHRCPRIRVT